MTSLTVWAGDLPEPLQGNADLPLAAPVGKFTIQLGKSGRIEALELPQGDCLSYTGGKRIRKSCAKGKALAQQTPLSPIRLGVDSTKLHLLAERTRKKDDYKYFEEKIRPESVLPENRIPLNAVERQAIGAQFQKIQSCAPEAFKLLSELQAAGRIQVSIAIADTEAALVPYESAPPILLSTRWARALSDGEQGWTPLREHLIKSDDDSVAIRKRYFGSATLTAQGLGEPSRDWWFVLGLLHEAGHVIQNADPQTVDAMTYYGFAGWIATEIMISQANWGSLDPAVKAEYYRATTQAERWKELVESGATYFALDLLAGCPVKL